MATNAIGLLVTGASLVFGRPITGIMSQHLKREQPGWELLPERYRVQRRLTWFWVLLWVWHLAVLVPLYALNAVAALAFVTTFILKPSIPIWLEVTFVWGRRSRENQTSAAG